MGRLNLTLDDDTYARLAHHAKQAGGRRAALARRILREGLDAREARERRRKLAADYAAGRKDARQILSGMEAAQLDWFDADE